MERQLKERLIGAAVLLAAAVIMVPEMFSGSGSGTSAPSNPPEAAAPGQLKTYRIDLHSAQQSSAPQSSGIDAPAELPRDEAPLMASTTAMSSASSASAAVSLPTSAASAPVSVKSSEKSSAAAATRTQPSSATQPNSGDWAVQIGSFSARDTAQGIAGDLKGQGYPAFVATVAVSGKTLYRVRVGAMSERSAAEAMLTKLHKAYPEASVVPNR